MIRDIASEEDIVALVDSFYRRVFIHEGLAPFFKQVDYPNHRPKMVAFWSFVLLDKSGYTTQVWDAHAHMRIQPELFHEWVNLFCITVDELYEGEISERAKLRAKTLGWTFAEKIKTKFEDEV
jgi:hemoglobin